MTIFNKIDTQDKVGTAVRYRNPKGSSHVVEHPELDGFLFQSLCKPLA